MLPQYGHSTQGVNLANYRIIAAQSASKSKPGGATYRSPGEWQQESKDYAGLAATEQLQSTSLRHSSNLLQVAAQEQVNADISSVEAALRAKIAHTHHLKVQLDNSVAAVETEMAACLTLRAQLEDRLVKVQQKIDLNSSRLQVRDARPTRERTMDEVEKALLRQQQMVITFAEKVKRAINHVDREVAQLQVVKAKLTADMHDKASAVGVDSAVLSVREDGTLQGGTEALARRRHDALMKTPHTWVRSTEENLKFANHWLADSARLRKAIRHAIYNSRTAEHAAAAGLHNAMMSKLGSTHNLKEELEQQLAKTRDEHARAAAQRRSLSAALEAKRGPLLQAKERFALRKARPDRETVQDDVEAALRNEIAHLNAATSQLSNKVSSVDKELENLEVAAAMLSDNLRDKQGALALDERCVLLDGRINITTPPPPSVASLAVSNASSAHSATLRRIAMLEGELLTARREREALEGSVGQLKASLGRPYSPSGPLSPSGPFSPKGLSLGR
ncbi:Tektin family-domain-containing protein [Haematococcus lacustris]